MPYFFSDQNLKLGEMAELGPPEAGHLLLSHRTKVGEIVKLQGPDGKRFLSEIVSTGKKSVKLITIEQLTAPLEPKVAITLFQSVVSEKALDFILQKGTELGLNKIILFNSSNTAVKLSQELYKKRQPRWEKILMEAAKQSERAKWPELEFVLGADDVLMSAPACDVVYLAEPTGNKLQPVNRSLKSVGLIVGPEGGFTEVEVKKFNSFKNLQAISLGPILLRAETAALAALANLRLLLE